MENKKMIADFIDRRIEIYETYLKGLPETEENVDSFKITRALITEIEIIKTCISNGK